MYRIYLSAPLTGVPKVETLKRFYERLGDTVTALGYSVYIPHLVSDPLVHPQLQPRDVYSLDRANVVQSDLLIAYVGVPAIGVGQEVEIAHQNRIPVVLMYEDARIVTRMVRGNPSVVREIVAGSRAQLLLELERTLCDSDFIAGRICKAKMPGAAAR